MSKKYSINLSIINFENGERIVIHSPTSNDSIVSSINNLQLHAEYIDDVNPILQTEPIFMRDYIPLIEDANTFNLYSFLLDAVSNLTEKEQEVFETILMKESDLVLAATIVLTKSYWLNDFGDDGEDYEILLNSLQGFVAYTSDLMNNREMLEKILKKYNNKFEKHQVNSRHFLKMLNNSIETLYYKEFDGELYYDYDDCDTYYDE